MKHVVEKHPSTVVGSSYRPKMSGIARMERNWGVLFALPAILGFIIFVFGPMVASLIFSITDWNIGADVHFIGLDNYQKMATGDPLFSKSLFVTLYYTLGSVPLGILASFLIAMLLNQKVRGLPFFRTIYYLPVLVPSIANSMLWLWLFNPDFGLFNSMLRSIGLSGSQWIYSETAAIPSLILMSTWGVGNAAVIFLAGLQGVPGHLYEAVEVDGGGMLRKFWHVTLPSMTPTIFFNIIMGMIGTLQVFDQAYVMTNGGPNNSTLFYIFYLYRKAFAEAQMGYAAALAWVLFLIIMALTALVFRSSRFWVYYEGEGKT
ncbi:carbohydrate ABC transporter permease [Paenibacillus sp. LHD-38]|jgi:multiple sugar transport system permease protein|uniref:carbohydrate ABC transporter permease n=1 Tax=Paenibacillus sp. LHD-38 TaxID=3072143 RepID=UPI0035BE7610